ncbi:MAG: hypothetical protein E6H54_09035 [Betaproteobacteria bacterium]|nr:MAG: hypothetical protein E6H54_09035 [Betaproteobacteria bacterium]
MKTHLVALAVAVTVTGLAALAVDVGMREGAERARLANSEPERVVITASREDQKLAAATTAFTF